MTCDELLKAMNDYVDGDIDPAICDGFAEHLAGCNPCQIVVDNIRQTIRLYKAGEPYPVPEVFAERLRESLAEQFRAKFGPGDDRSSSSADNAH